MRACDLQGMAALKSRCYLKLGEWQLAILSEDDDPIGDALDGSEQEHLLARSASQTTVTSTGRRLLTVTRTRGDAAIGMYSKGRCSCLLYTSDAADE